jgi:hypothetical protein
MASSHRSAPSGTGGFLGTRGAVEDVQHAIPGQKDYFAATVAVHVTGRHAGAVMSGQSVGFALHAHDQVRLLDPQLPAAVVVDGNVTRRRDKEVFPSVVVDIGDDDPSGRVLRRRDVQLDHQRSLVGGEAEGCRGKAEYDACCQYAADVHGLSLGSGGGTFKMNTSRWPLPSTLLVKITNRPSRLMFARGESQYSLTTER